MTVGNNHPPAGWQEFRMTNNLTFETAPVKFPAPWGENKFHLIPRLLAAG